MSRVAPSRSEASVAVVSVTYNRVEPLLTLLAQLRELDYPQELLSVFLVDNASTDDTVEIVRARFPEVHLVESPVNTGVSAGFNRSIEEALGAARRHKYIWLLDSDAEVEPGTLAPLVAAMEADDRIGIVGSAVYDPKERGRLVTAGFRADWERGDIPTFVPERTSEDGLHDVDLVPACSLLARSEVCRSIGPWDARFPLYWGDTDWCARVLQAGHRVCCHEGSRAWHREWDAVQRGFGAPDFIRDHRRGALLFFLRYGQLGGTRRLLLHSYLYAALEHLTLREDFGQAYQEAVDDVLHGSFLEKDFARSQQSTPEGLDAMIDAMAPRLGSRPRVLLNQIGDPELVRRVRHAFEQRFDAVRWEEVPPSDAMRSGWTEYRCFRRDQIPELLLRLVTPFRRADVAVSEISNPMLQNLAAARQTLLLDGSGRGRRVENRVLSGLLGFLATGLRGLKAAFIDLPKATRDCPALREAMADKHGASSGGWKTPEPAQGPASRSPVL